MRMQDLSCFMEDYSAEEIVKVYSALDAFPGYLVKFDPSVSVEKNIEERIFRKGEFFNQKNCPSISILFMHEVLYKPIVRNFNLL